MVLTDQQKFLIAMFAIIIVIIIIIIIFGVQSPSPVVRQVSLTMWGIESQNDYRSLLADFEHAFPLTRIIYTQKDKDNYETELIDALAAGQGPDIFMVHNTWLPKHQNKLYPIDSQKLSFVSFRSLFPEVIEADFSRTVKTTGQTAGESRIYALPLFLDTLALYYNKDHFNATGIVFPPLTWKDFQEDVLRLTKFNAFGQIEVSGAAFGTSRNINRFSDILSFLMMQHGNKMFDSQNNTALFHQSLKSETDNRSLGERALDFYTQFSLPGKPYYNWNEEMHYSIDAFSEGKADMLLNYAYQMPAIKSKAPYLNFGISFAPQISSDAQAVHFANYWGLGVSQSSKYKEKAWDAVLYFTAKLAVAEKYFEIFKKPPALRPLIEKYKEDPIFGVFCKQALTAKSWYQVDNLAIENIFDNMVKSVLEGRDTISGAVNKAAGQIELLARNKK